jgi:hypothetical protein
MPVGDWLDQVTVEIRVVEYPDRPPLDVLIIELFGDDTGSTGMSPDEIAEQLEAATVDETGMERFPFTLDVRRSKFSWGADAAAATVAIQVGLFAVGYVASAIQRRVGKGVDNALDQVIERIIEAGRRGDPFTPQALERSEALERAEWAVRSVYSIADETELRVAVEEHDLHSQAWTIALESDSGERFETELVATAGLVRITRVRREASP